MRSRTMRAKRICSAMYLDSEISNLESLFQKNGYRLPIVKKSHGQYAESEATRFVRWIKACLYSTSMVGNLVTLLQEQNSVFNQKDCALV